MYSSTLYHNVICSISARLDCSLTPVCVWYVIYNTILILHVGNEWVHWGNPPCGAKRHMDLMQTSRVSVQVHGSKHWRFYPLLTEEELQDMSLSNWTKVSEVDQFEERYCCHGSTLHNCVHMHSTCHALNMPPAYSLHVFCD